MKDAKEIGQQAASLFDGIFEDTVKRKLENYEIALDKFMSTAKLVLDKRAEVELEELRVKFMATRELKSTSIANKAREIDDNSNLLAVEVDKLDVIATDITARAEAIGFTLV